MNDAPQFRRFIRIQPQHQPEAAAQRSADHPLPRGRADGGEALDLHRMRSRARPGADQDVHPKIFERRINHLLDVRQQAVNFVDEENLALIDVRQNPAQVQLLLQHRTRRLLNPDAQFLRDDSRQRRFPQPWRPVEQHVIHRLAALFRRLDRDGEVFLDLRLPREVRQPAGAKRSLKLLLLLAQRRRYDPLLPHEVLVY